MSKARKALLDLVNGNLVETSKTKPVPRQFIDDFELVAEHYGLKHISEYFQAKDAARSDLENAIICYQHLAEEIRGGKA